MKKGMGNAVSNVNSETSRMVAVREPTLRTTANSRTMAEMMASKDEGITLKILKGNLGKHSIMIMAVKQMISIHIISDPSFQWCVS